MIRSEFAAFPNAAGRPEVELRIDSPRSRLRLKANQPLRLFRTSQQKNGTGVAGRRFKASEGWRADKFHAGFRALCARPLWHSTILSCVVYQWSCDAVVAQMSPGFIEM